MNSHAPFGSPRAAARALEPWGLGVLLLVAPLAFAGSQPWAWAGLLALALGLTVLGVLSRLPRDGGVKVARAPLVLALGILAVLLLLQQIPLPEGLIEICSPRADQVLGEVLPGRAAAGIWQPLSLDRPGGLEAAFKGILYGLAFLLAAGLARKGKGRTLLFLLVGLGAFQALYGLFEVVSGGAKIFAWLKPMATRRASGSYVNPNHFAALMGMAIPCALGMAVLVAPAGLRRQVPTGFRQRLIAGLADPATPKRALFLFAAAVLAVALAASLSKGGVLAALGGVVALALSLARKGRRGGVVILLGVGAAVLWVSSLGVEQLMARFLRIDASLSLSTGSRLSFALDTLRMAGDFPLAGVGAGAFEAIYPVYQSVEMQTRLTHAHCDYVEWLAELGWGGFVALLLGVGLTWWRAWRSARADQNVERSVVALTALAAVVPIAIHSLFDFSLRMPANALWVAALLGVAWGAARPRSVWRIPVRGRGQQIAMGVVACALAALIGVTALVYARADWVAEPRIERAQPSERPRPLQIADLERALENWPWRADHLGRLATLRWEEVRAAQLKEARKAAVSLGNVLRTSEQSEEDMAQTIVDKRLRTREDVATEAREIVALVDRGLRLAPGSQHLREVRAWIVEESALGDE